ncbi:MAG TPA: M20/M25/M40 family metallo-hydrolase [Gemmatimonadales bacterium]|nr:M20/M25/M40 family metallo-hydrolase [Gemmatimonadales bacterium]
MHRCLLAPALLCAAAAGLSAQSPPSPPGPADDGTLPALTKIAGQGTMQSHAYAWVTELSDDIGSRVTGSPEMWQAVDWGVARMKAIGLENVHVERYQMWRGWTRGTAEIELLSPRRVRLHVAAMGWTGSTAGSVEADVVPVNLYQLDQELQNPSRWKGKVLLIVTRGEPPKDRTPLFAAFGSFVKQAAAAGAVAVIGGQGGAQAAGMNLTHTGILGFSADFSIPVVSMTAEDQGLLERDLDQGKALRVRVNIRNSFTPGPVEAANVVGEIRGREHPEQVFVVGAHLDSWDLAEGTTDNGCGSVAVLGAAEAIARSGERPRRTIRFVLFTGEEQGLLGSFAYVKQHQAEMANHLGDLVLDEGQGPIKGFSLGGRDDLVAAFRPFASALGSFRAFTVDDHIELGTDTAPFSLQGLPGINLDNGSPDYRYTHHSAADALEAVSPDVMAQNATVMAMTAYWVADRPERLAAPWPADRTEQKFVAEHQDGLLKAFGIWPFGAGAGASPGSN